MADDVVTNDEMAAVWIRFCYCVVFMVLSGMFWTCGTGLVPCNTGAMQPPLKCNACTVVPAGLDSNQILCQFGGLR
jgi:hypothetical protein